MTRPLPLLPAWLYGELAPRPGRWRQAVAMSAAGTVALAIALGLQVASFPAPLLAFRALQPSVVCTWRNLLQRLVIIAVATVLTIPVVGFVVQLPWLLLPTFVLAISVLTYIAPVRESPVLGYCIALIIGATAYTGVFAPLETAATAFGLAGSFAIGLIVATVVAELAGVEHADQRLSASLAAQFERAQMRLREAGARYRAELPADATGAAAAPVTALPDYGPGPMPQHLALLDLMRQERRYPELERAFVALITAAERIDLFVAVVDTLSRRTTIARAYHHLLDRELIALFDAIDLGLGRFARAARQPASVLSSDAAPTQHAGPWPDFATLIATLHEHQHALYTSGQFAVVGVEEASDMNALVQSLDGLSDVLHLPPEALEHIAPEMSAAPPRVAAFDPYAAQFALKIGVGSALCLLIGVASNTRALETIVLNPLLLAQGSYGATLRRSDLRIISVFVGGVISALVTVLVMPNTTEPAVWLLVFFAVVLPSSYVALGTARFGYFGVQVATTFMIVLVAEQPMVDIHATLWRFFGTLLGSALLLGTFQVFLPDYAGRQIISRFGDLLRDLLSVVPTLDQPIPKVEETQRRSDRMVKAFADVLRLSDELWYEGTDSGVERHAAVDAAGVLRRIAHRWALIRRSRRTARPPLPAPVHGAVAALERPLHAYLRLLLALVEARHDRGRPGSRSNRAALAAASAVAARPRPDIVEPLRNLESAVADARRDALLSWPVSAASALLAEVDHLRRLVELMPALDQALLHMSLPAAAAHLPALAAAPPATAAARGRA